VYLRYTIRPDDLNEWSPMFGIFMAYLLAAKGSMAMKFSDEVEARMYVLAERYRVKAIIAEGRKKFYDSTGVSLITKNR